MDRHPATKQHTPDPPDTNVSPRLMLLLGLALAALLTLLVLQPPNNTTREWSDPEISHSAFKGALHSGQVLTVTLTLQDITGWLKGEKFFYTIRVDDPRR